jgi:hypothetical protein
LLSSSGVALKSRANGRTTIIPAVISLAALFTSQEKDIKNRELLLA